MASDATVLEHLLDGRDALVLEVKRLTTAIAELDSVIARIGGAERRTGIVDAEPDSAETVNPPAEPETSGPEARTTRAATRPPRKAATPRSRATRAPAKAPAAAPGGKSIRVHVLEMLASEEREFGLAEIIDRIHAEGIQAHDDAVRSITIKLMKDGRVERVGRGQYRLTRRGGAAAPVTASEPPTEAAGGSTDSSPNYVPPLNLGESWGNPGN